MLRWVLRISFLSPTHMTGSLSNQPGSEKREIGAERKRKPLTNSLLAFAANQKQREVEARSERKEEKNRKEEEKTCVSRDQDHRRDQKELGPRRILFLLLLMLLIVPLLLICPIEVKERERM